MADLPLLSEAQMALISPHFPLSHGVARVDDRRVVSGIVYVLKAGMRWCDAPEGYGPRKTLYNRFIRWSRMGVFNRIFASLAGAAGTPDTLMIDATHLKARRRRLPSAHRTASSLQKKGLFPAISGAPKAA